MILGLDFSKWTCTWVWNFTRILTTYIENRESCKNLLPIPLHNFTRKYVHSIPKKFFLTILLKRNHLQQDWDNDWRTESQHTLNTKFIIDTSLNKAYNQWQTHDNICNNKLITYELQCLRKKGLIKNNFKNCFDIY
jgi:hypothetical protein